MKDMFKKKLALFPIGQASRKAHIRKCIAADMCPKCGDDIFIREEVFDNDLGMAVSCECSACDWKNYDYVDN